MRCLLRIAYCAGSAALFLAAGCQTEEQSFPRIINEPAPLPESVRGTFGRVGVLPVAALTNSRFARPPSDLVPKATYQRLLEIEGAIRNPEKKFEPQLSRIKFNSLVSANVDGISSVVSGISVDDIQQSQARLRVALASESVELGIDKQLTRVLARHPVTNLVLLPESVLNEVKQRGARTDFSALRSRGVDSVLDVRVGEIGFEYRPGANPELAFTPEATISVLRVGDGSVLYSSYLDYRGTKHRFVDWAVDDAKAFRIELSLAARAFVESLMEQYFGLNPHDAAGPPPSE